MYVEIWQALFVLLFVAVLVTVIQRLVSHINYQSKVQDDLRESFRKAALAQIEAARKDIPEDWELRGTPSVWEYRVPPDQLAVKRQCLFNLSAAYLSDEELAQLALTLIKNRVPAAENDKVFTRLAGRIFKIVELNRKVRKEQA